MKDYEKIYRSKELYWGAEPSEIVKRFAELAPPGAALDLGMGEGRDTLFLASKGFTVTGVEKSAAGVEKAQLLARERGLSVDARIGDARELRIPKNRYSLIAALNLLQFIDKSDAAALVERAIAGLKKGGLFIATVFTYDDPHFKLHKKKSREISPGVFRVSDGQLYSLYDYGELLALCQRRTGSAKAASSQPNQPTKTGLRTIHYAEYDYYDTGHGQPHWHGVAEFAGRKL